MNIGHAFFVTGTDTEIGKTYAVCTLLHAARKQGIRAVGLKPVATGIDANGKNGDVEALRAASALALPDRLMNPYLFSPPIAPHIAAWKIGVNISFAPILEAVNAARQQAELVLVEGAGGFRVPLGEEGDSAALAVALNIPVVLVVGLRLGCINHALLSAEAIVASNLPMAGWIANILTPDLPALEENLETLSMRLPAPCLGRIPHALPDGPEEAAGYLELP
jgi:dethiobiotin synthetase